LFKKAALIMRYIEKLLTKHWIISSLISSIPAILAFVDYEYMLNKDWFKRIFAIGIILIIIFNAFKSYITKVLISAHQKTEVYCNLVLDSQYRISQKKCTEYALLIEDSLDDSTKMYFETKKQIKNILVELQEFVYRAFKNEVSGNLKPNVTLIYNTLKKENVKFNGTKNWNIVSTNINENDLQYVLTKDSTFKQLYSMKQRSFYSKKNKAVSNNMYIPGKNESYTTKGHNKVIDGTIFCKKIDINGFGYVSLCISTYSSDIQLTDEGLSEFIKYVEYYEVRLVNELQNKYIFTKNLNINIK